MNVGFIGLGSQGLPIAQRILAGGHALHLWARRPESLQPFAGTAAVTVGSPAALGYLCKVVGVCVLDDDAVRDVVFQQGLLAAMHEASVLAIHSTVSPELVREIAEAAADRGVDVLDAPVSGGAAGAAAGTLAVMVGGSSAGLERALPVFETFGNPVQRVGEVGAGQLCKLVNNTLFAANVGLALDALALGESLGLRRDALLTMLGAGSAASFGLKMAPQVTNPASAAHAGGLLQKDVALLTHQRVAHGLPESAMERTASDAVDRILGNAR
ncbi:MAG: NAD(P)-dependent oxidoreductase [Actinomycetota bacterium]|nr:NAD(P)-dependent oxidoreductase [Actinomycetota bacterium]